MPALRRTYERFAPATIGIEATAFQLSIVQEARRAGLPIKAQRAERDKVSRALTAAARAEGGRVFFERGASYLEALEGELTAFPAGRHDDIVDVISYAAVEVANLHGGPRATWIAGPSRPSRRIGG